MTMTELQTQDAQQVQIAPQELIEYVAAFFQDGRGNWAFIPDDQGNDITLTIANALIALHEQVNALTHTRAEYGKAFNVARTMIAQLRHDRTMLIEGLKDERKAGERSAHAALIRGLSQMMDADVAAVIAGWLVKGDDFAVNGHAQRALLDGLGTAAQEVRDLLDTMRGACDFLEGDNDL